MISLWFMALLLGLSIAVLAGFNRKLVANADDWISSPLDSHVVSGIVQPDKWKLLDREGNEWPTQPEEALEELQALKGAEAKARLDSIYHIFYGQSYSVVQAENKRLFGLDGKYSGHLGISGIAHSEGYNVQTTISSELSYEMIKAMRASGANDGSAMAVNYKTGEILASVSMPSHSVGNLYVSPLADDYEKENGWLYNRNFQTLFSPGSVQKIAAAIACLRYRRDIDLTVDKNRIVYDCDGSYETADGKKINCAYAHGRITFIEAFSLSCNGFFAKSAISMGQEKLSAVAQELGYNKTLSYENFSLLAKSEFLLHAGVGSYSLGWSAVGQSIDGSKVEALPYHMLILASAIANKGTAMQPYSVSWERTRGDEPVELYKASPKAVPESLVKMKPEEAMDMGILMENVCRGSGTAAVLGDAVEKLGYTAAAKTGTAEISASGRAVVSWIVCFIKEEEAPLAMVIALTSPSEGKTAAETASEIMPAAISLVKHGN
ncbi:MAG: hypothetical protein LBU32_10645 [Clostridiales bacterium]|jgi:peptidoglycan glycosyltransferase|nr:hypothetical protein [Clostridiales bacterium]